MSYIDGLLFNTSYECNSLPPNDDPLIIGHKFVEGELAEALFGWHGGIDDIRIYSRFLTQEEIAEKDKLSAEFAAIEAAKQALAAKREAAKAKLEALGLDADDLRALGL